MFSLVENHKQKSSNCWEGPRFPKSYNIRRGCAFEATSAHMKRVLETLSLFMSCRSLAQPFKICSRRVPALLQAITPLLRSFQSESNNHEFIECLAQRCYFYRATQVMCIKRSKDWANLRMRTGCEGVDFLIFS